VKAVVQRVSSSRVVVDGAAVGAIGRGLLVLLCAAPGDDEKAADELARRIVNARIFPDENGRMNLSLLQVGGELLVVPQFTLLADTTQRRPSFVGALEPGRANELYERFRASAARDARKVEGGRFGAHMEVELVNDGPVTLIYESAPSRAPL
jgi:D-tyrosyl-tRNA(Tyr) deacylase